MANLTTYGANAILDGTAVPATLYVKWHIGNPGASAANNAAAESTRKSFTRAAAAGGASSNVDVIEWLNAAATEDISHISVWDAASGGNPWWVAARTGGPLSVTAGETIQIAPGELDLSFGIWS